MRREIYPEELNYFYQKTGEAIWHLQIVEDFLVKLYMVKGVIVSPGRLTEIEAQSELVKLEKKTLGQLISLLEKSDWVSQDFIVRLKEFNSIRKWIVHNSGRQSGESLYTDQGRFDFISKIVEFTNLAVGFQKEIRDSLVDYGEEKNVSKENIFDEARIRIDRLKSRI